jgi:hypothetical protein
MIPQRVQTMRGPNVGTGTWSGHGSALRIARWWHCQQDTSSDCTPLARMLPRVMGGPAWDRGRVLMTGRIPRRLRCPSLRPSPR